MVIHPYNLPEPAHPQRPLIAAMTKTRIHLLTIIQGLILVVYENAHGFHFEALSANGEVYRHSGVYYSASSAKAKGRQWIQQLTLEEEDF
jgi:hypothetical protein